MVGGSGGVIGGCSGMVGSSLGVDRDTLVRHIGDVTIVVIGGVLDVLGSTVGKGNRVTSGNGTVNIGGLGGVKLSLGVVISNTILKGVGGWLLFVVGGVRGRVTVGRGVSNDRGGVGNHGSTVHNRDGVGNHWSVVHNRGMVGSSRSVVDRACMVDWDRVVGGSSVVDYRSVVRAGGMIRSYNKIYIIVY